MLALDTRTQAAIQRALFGVALLTAPTRCGFCGRWPGVVHWLRWARAWWSS